jgi:hypothetical protein
MVEKPTSYTTALPSASYPPTPKKSHMHSRAIRISNIPSVSVSTCHLPQGHLFSADPQNLFFRNMLENVKAIYNPHLVAAGLKGRQE